jgi:hypothetical protein
MAGSADTLMANSIAPPMRCPPASATLRSCRHTQPVAPPVERVPVLARAHRVRPPRQGGADQRKRDGATRPWLKSRARYASTEGGRRTTRPRLRGGAGGSPQRIRRASRHLPCCVPATVPICLRSRQAASGGCPSPSPGSVITINDRWRRIACTVATRCGTCFYRSRSELSMSQPVWATSSACFIT